MHFTIIKVSSLQVWVFSSFSLEVKVFLHLKKHYNLLPYGGVEVMFHTFMISALDGDNWLASLSHHLTTRP
jgi:hypothetical protein